MKKLIFTIFISCQLLYSHPHFFVDTKLNVKKNVINNEWIFDRLNSRVLLFDFDLNANRIFDEDEKKEFIKAHFKSLKTNNYNIFFATNDEQTVVPSNIVVEVKKKRISLSFDIVADLSDEFTMCTMDEKIYMAYKLENVSSINKIDVQKSEYDFCIGVSNE